MLDGILGRGFASKCKSLIKLTKSRIDVIRRKRNATQKFLKKDMADLLANGLDVNAYGRAEGLLVELTLSSCYDFVEHCCDFLSKNLSVMQKQSECPEECKEAVSSLMFAAARFSDLPELRDLRQIFHERYGNSLDYCLNREFAEKLAQKPFTMEKKVHLMKDIASEFSINWNARDFEQRMSKKSAYEQNNPKNNGVLHVGDEKYKVPKNGKEIPPRGDASDFPAIEVANDRQKLRKGWEADNLKRDELDLPAVLWDHPSDNQKVLHEWEVPIIRKDQHDTPPRGKQDFHSDRRRKESADPKIMRPDASSHRKQDEYANNETKHSRVREKNVQERENMGVPSHMRPGYVDNFAANSSKSEVKVTSLVTKRENADVPFHVRREYLDSFAATSSKSEVKVTSFVNNGHGHQNSTNSLGRAKSEGDRPYSKKSEVTIKSFVNNGDGNHSNTKSVERVKSEGDRPYFNCALPPPYVKPNSKAKDANYRSNSEIAPAAPNFNGIPKSPAGHKSATDRRLEDVQLGSCYPEKKASEDVGPARGNIHTDEKDSFKHRDEANGFPLPKARSSRRRHSKSRSAHDEAHDHDEDAGGGKRSSRSRRDDPRQGLQILFDDERYQKDEEERIIDKLLIHYSKKSSTYEGGRVKRKSRSRRHDGVGTDAGEFPLNRRAEIERADDEFGVVAAPRSVSLPREQPSAPPEPTKVFTRAATFQPDRSNAAKHVHPKLPDYDDLAARFAALKGR
ncbi:uncharacterized protein LOC116195424 [Punica granatum]|uniref:IST1-like protein n=2 Tax=Punica granatum TaxID=22663 RepID=A0A218XZ78_PUNGR|nr:uncharacterized protein LOC116195424 [Punica granatum]OWM89909.1 hypothetical protein CDL15_Pgr012546 [Punica granatum]PKI50782.1 hypothetical protein CRG98_028777 [Punica granatum]